MDYRKAFLGFITILGLIASCGYYSFKGALPSHLKTVAVQLFNSQAQEPGLGETLTNKLIEKFIADNSLQVVDQSQADLIITGTISPIPPAQPAIVKEGETVSEMIIEVKVKAKALDVKKNKALFKENFSHKVTLDAAAGLEEREQAINEALDIIAEEIVNSALSGW